MIKMTGPWTFSSYIYVIKLQIIQHSVDE
jgi:hypothetical protein